MEMERNLGKEIAIRLLALALALLVSRSAAGGEIDFGAYHTELKSGQSWEAYSRTGEYADVSVNVARAGGSLVFWRGNSYLPYWKTAKGRWSLPEIIPRTGDGVDPMPDRCNVYSHVQVIENSPARVIVRWRYLPSFTAGNPHGDVRTEKFVSETFLITPDGKMNRVVKQATKTIDEWNDPVNQTEEEIQLTESGVVEESRKGPALSARAETVLGFPGKKATVAPPVLRFSFDEGAGVVTGEGITRTTLPIAGRKALWKKGVFGAALEFDGYGSAIVLPAAKAPALASGSITLEGWFALGAYPWDWAPIIQQGDEQGYFLGVDSHGFPGFMVEAGGEWQQLSVPNAPPYTDDHHLELFRWRHLAGVYNQQEGTMRLYVDGTEVAQKLVGTGGLQSAPADVRIGKAGILRKPTDGTHDTKPSEFGLDGLIDEVRVYDRALDAAQIAQSFSDFYPGANIAAAPDMQNRRLPTFRGAGKFGAVYTHLPYYETWDNLWCADKYSDLVVEFAQSPVRLIFWRGASYIPVLVNESEQWFMNEFSETGFNKDAPGDCEPMSDKACVDSHVRLIENSDARVVVHWRYRLANTDHHWAYFNEETGWGDIADWYYYIYPDGVVSKRMRCYSSRPDKWHEWDEQIVVFGEGQHPESVIAKAPVMTLVDGAGKAFDYNWDPDPPRPAYAGKFIQMIHLTGRYSPFTIQAFDKGDIYRGERTWYSVFPSWNHWPSSQVESSGRNASFTDRAAHSSISHLFWPYSNQQAGDVSFQEKNLLEGMTDQPAATLTNLARSWLKAPGVSEVAGGGSEGFIQAERAYAFKMGEGPLRFHVDASDESPIYHPCFRIKNWRSRTTAAEVTIDGQRQMPGANFRQGVSLDPDGTYSLIIWLGVEASRALAFQVNAR